MRAPDTAHQTIDRWTRTGQLDTLQQIADRAATCREDIEEYWKDHRYFAALRTEQEIEAILRDLFRVKVLADPETDATPLEM